MTTTTPSPATTAGADQGPTTGTAETSFDIGGMTCASCVGRVEKALTRVDGVVDGLGEPRHRDRPGHPRPDRRRPPTS